MVKLNLLLKLALAFSADANTMRHRLHNRKIMRPKDVQSNGSKPSSFTTKHDSDSSNDERRQRERLKPKAVKSKSSALSSFTAKHDSDSSGDESNSGEVKLNYGLVENVGHYSAERVEPSGYGNIEGDTTPGVGNPYLDVGNSEGNTVTIATTTALRNRLFGTSADTSGSSIDEQNFTNNYSDQSSFSHSNLIRDDNGSTTTTVSQSNPSYVSHIITNTNPTMSPTTKSSVHHITLDHTLPVSTGSPGINITSPPFFIGNRLDEKDGKLTDGVAHCTLAVDSNAFGRSVAVPFYYQLETTTSNIAGELLGMVEHALIVRLCSSDEKLKRLLNGRRQQEAHSAVSWDSYPKDVVSNNYMCSPSNIEAQLCRVIKGGVTVVVIEGNNEENDDSIVSYVHEKIKDLFDALFINDPRVIGVNYIGVDASSLEPFKQLTDAESDVHSEGKNFNYSQIVLVAAIWTVLMTALVARFRYTDNRGKDADGRAGFQDKQFEEHSLAHETMAMTITTVPTHRDVQRESTILPHGCLLSPTTCISQLPIRHSDAELYTKHFILAEDEAPQSTWCLPGIIPETVNKRGSYLECIREEVSSASGSDFYDEKSV